FFASTEAWGGSWIPFLDVRGHLFNNGRSAINAGVGARYVASRIWGINGYYDYRHTFRGHYNQVSLGLESLGKVWDFRLNIYHPFGKKIYYFGPKKEFAFQAFNGEAALHVNTFKKAPLYFALGPYYLNGEGKTAWGNEVRAQVSMYQHIRLEVSFSYDRLYKWISQGQLGIFFLLGGKKEGKSCSARSFQRVDRSEIIPVS
ncbi:MAG: inverse autotransporter beta domain-containing protein, partial [Rhabdochlamydiaceae bacterium]